MNIHDWFPLGLTGLIILLSKGLSRVFSNSSKASVLWHSAFFTVQLSHPYVTTGKAIALTRWTFVGKVMSLLFNMLSRLVITSSEEQASFNFMVTVTICSDFGDPQNKVSHCFHCSSIYLPWSDGTGCHDLLFWMLSFKRTFPLSTFTFIKRLFSSSSLSATRVVSSAYLRFFDISPSNLDSSLCFFQPSVSHGVLWIEVK